jgi:hypothetical protein
MAEFGRRVGFRFLCHYDVRVRVSLPVFKVMYNIYIYVKLCYFNLNFEGVKLVFSLVTKWKI